MAANVTPTLADKLGGYQNQSGLHALLEAVAARLRTQTLFTAKAIRVLPEYDGDMINQLNAVLNKKLSVLAMVGFEAANAAHSSLSAMMKDIRLEVKIFESVMINQGSTGTRVSALSFAEAALASLHQWAPTASASLVNPQSIRMAEQNTLRLDREESQPASGMICYTTRFVTAQCLSCHCS
jgi:hypothetical protein